MRTLETAHLDMVSGGLAAAGPSMSGMLDAAITGFASYGYGLMLDAVGLEGGAAALATGVAAYMAHEIPPLPAPPNGKAFYVYKL